jgi:hypothetical protein
MEKHKMSESRFFVRYQSIKNRCNNSSINNYSYTNYGARGIKCLWNSFEEFKNDMYESYQSHIKEFGEKNTSIDRIDVNGHYCKENCRWATRKEQGRNKRNNSFYEFNGKKHSILEWSEVMGINYNTLYTRIRRNYTKDKIFNNI